MEEEYYEELLRYEDEIYKDKSSSSGSEEEDFLKDPSILYGQIFYSSEKPQFITEEKTNGSQKTKEKYNNEQQVARVSGIPEESLNNTTNINISDNESDIKVMDGNGNFSSINKSEIILISDSEDDESFTNVRGVDTNASSDKESKYLISRKTPSSFDLQDSNSSDDEFNSQETKGKKMKVEAGVKTSMNTSSNRGIMSSALETHLISPINFRTHDSMLKGIKMDHEPLDTSPSNGPSKRVKASDNSAPLTHQELKFKESRCQNCGSREHNENVCEKIMYPDNDELTWRRYKLRTPSRNPKVRISCYKCASQNHYGKDCDSNEERSSRETRRHDRLRR